MARILEIMTDPSFWSRMWTEIVRVLSSGSPPVYVQYLIITVIYLAYLLFVFDPRRVRNMPLSKWLGNPTSLVYFLAIIIVTAGGLDFLKAVSDPQTYVETLESMKPTRIPIISDIKP
jgi:hypothetical protein